MIIANVWEVNKEEGTGNRDLFSWSGWICEWSEVKRREDGREGEQRYRIG